MSFNIFKWKFVLYSTELEGEKTFEKVNGEFVKLEKPVKIKMMGALHHMFPCTLTQAFFNWRCLVQIFTSRTLSFYHTVIGSKNELKAGTQFYLFLFPFWYIHSVIQWKMFHKVKIFYS